jgi:hypothetical protein
MSSFEETCRPVIFKHDDPEYSYWGKGSSFLIATSRAFYWVTASHVLSNMGGSAQSLRILPSDHTQISLPFNGQYTIKRGLAEDEDHKDIFVQRIDLNEFDGSGDFPLVAQDIDQGMLSAEDLKPDNELWVVGYPAESNIIDYDSRKFRNTRSVLRAIYRGQSISDHCHELKIESSIKLGSYDGLSGSPVFHMKSREVNGETLSYPLLVGMLIRGTALSETAYFISSSVIVSLISEAENNA